MTVKLTIALKKSSFDHLGNPGSFAGNPGTARVCPCMATGLPLFPYLRKKSFTPNQTIYAIRLPNKIYTTIFVIVTVAF